MTMFQVLG